MLEQRVVTTAAKWGLRQLLRSAKIKQYLGAELSAGILQLPQIRFAPPGHFYSPLPDLEEVEAEAERLSRLEVPAAISLNADEQFRLLTQILACYPEIPWTEKPKRGMRYWFGNEYFGWGDAIVLFGMLRHMSSRRVVEVGSGFSSAAMLDTNELFCGGRIEFTFIEPFPQRLRQLMNARDVKRVNVIESSVQKVPFSRFETLQANDILFIDSSHVSKIGSDVNYLLFEVLPRLNDGVIVHFHDVLYPFEYPLEWVREGRAWNEVYLLRAFLQYNQTFEVMLFNSYLGHSFRDYVAAIAPLITKNFGGSLWLRKKG